MNLLTMRKMSGFPLSLSTGFAMETLFAPRSPVYDHERMAPERVPYANYSTLSVNILTLIRNILNATTYEDIRQIRPAEMLEALSQEMEIILSLCANEGKGLIRASFYTSDYSSFYRGKGPEYKLRVPTTDKQKQWFALLSETENRALRGNLSVAPLFRATSPSERCVVLTHLPPDLLQHRQFQNLELLESHTGKVKTRREWNTKYHPMGSEKFENMPWCKPLLCYLGDKYVLSPLSTTIRKKLLDLAKERHWTPMTSDSTVYMDCMNKIQNQEIVRVLRQISLH